MRTKFLLIVFFFGYLAQAQTDSLRLMFAGDMMNHGPQIKSAYQVQSNSYDYTENFQYVDSIFRQADFVIANLETTLGVKPYSGYPQFSAPVEFPLYAKKAGINIMATANNHSCDKGLKGIVNTLDVLDTLNIIHFGTYRNVVERDSLTPLIIEKNNIKIVLLNYSYGTNGIAVPRPAVVNLIDKEQIKTDIEKAKKHLPDAIIVFLHWGTQYKYKPNQSQKDLVKFLHEQGVNIIIGSHPHVLQPVEYEYDVLNDIDYLTVYSLGNFISNQRKYPRDGAMIFSMNLTKDEQGKIRIKKYESIPVWVYKYQKDKKNHYEILPVEDFKLRPDYFQKNSDYQKMMRYYKFFKQMFDVKLFSQ